MKYATDLRNADLCEFPHIERAESIYSNGWSVGSMNARRGSLRDLTTVVMKHATEAITA